jgi:hypothetical protein
MGAKKERGGSREATCRRVACLCAPGHATRPVTAAVCTHLDSEELLLPRIPHTLTRAPPPAATHGARAYIFRFADAVHAACEDAGRSLGATGGDAGGRYCLAAFLLTRGPGHAPEVVALGAGGAGWSFLGGSDARLPSRYLASWPPCARLVPRPHLTWRVCTRWRRHQVPLLFPHRGRRAARPPRARLPCRAARSSRAAALAALPAEGGGRGRRRCAVWYC